MIDNADGRVLETGLIRGNSRLPTKRTAAFLRGGGPVAGVRLAAPDQNRGTRGKA